MPVRAYISIGSNIDREHNIRSAIDCLRGRYGELMISSVYETEAVGFDGAPFYNLVVGFDTDDSIDVLSDWLDEIENRHGRDRSGPRFGPRTLDMDLLLYGDVVSSAHKVPRDEITHYAFVLGPLAEIAPDDICPANGRCFAELWREFDQTGQALHKVSLTLQETS